MFARYDRMAKQFSRVGKEITIAVKAGGPDADNNPALRRALVNGRAVNMPKDKVESAIKRAQGRDMTNYEELTYEGYGPHGVAVIVETATDNPTRTVAKVRAVFNKFDGSLGTSNSVSFQFKKMGVFELELKDHDLEELELELIDYGLEELGEGTSENDEEVIVIRVPFVEFGSMQSALEERKMEIKGTKFEWIPLNQVELSNDEEEKVLKMLAKMEEEEDVQQVFHNLK